MFIYKALDDTSYTEIAECFNLAFSDYAIPVKLSDSALEVLFKKSGVDRKYCYGAFENDKMVGFIFNSCNMYNGEMAVFDSGTGVIPQYRGSGVFSALFEYAKDNLKKLNVKTCYLEVLQENLAAIAAYKKKGFEVTREFLVLKSPDTLLQSRCDTVKTSDFCDFDKLNTSKCEYIAPSFEHSFEILNICPNLYKVMYIEENGFVSAFCIFAEKNAGIVGMGYSDISDLKAVIENMMSSYAGFTFKNIDTSYENVVKLLFSLGFKEITRQYEMKKELF